jgi:hypothetical protein
MNKVALLIPYFGELPKYAKAFFYTAKWNVGIDFILFTDVDFEYQADNIIVHKMTFSEIGKMFQNKFDFKICLDAPYKLCDYKPAYGYVFSEYLREYEFWGYCDIDIILGDILSFLPNEVLKNNKKIYQYGHLCFYKNTQEINEFFMIPGGMDYRQVFSKSIICVFDEISGIQQKFDLTQTPTYKNWDFMDVNPWKYHIKRCPPHVPQVLKDGKYDYIDECFFWEKGKVYRAALDNGKIIYKEFNYFHFQKRKYDIPFLNMENVDAFFLDNEGISIKEPGMNVTVQQIAEHNLKSKKKEIKFYLKKQKFIWKRRFRKYLLRKG